MIDLNKSTPKEKAAGGVKTTAATRSICTIDSTGSLVQAHGRNLWTTSRLISEKFGKRHGNVIRAIENLACSREFHQLNFESVDYMDDGGKPRKSYDISRDGFSRLAMGFTGKEASKWQELFITAFGKMERELQRIARRKTDLDLRLVSGERSAAALLMTDCLMDARKEAGKDTKERHYSNEHRLCNAVLTGRFGPVDVAAMDAATQRRIVAIRRRNSVLIAKGQPYAKRKETLCKEFPLLALPQAAMTGDARHE